METITKVVSYTLDYINSVPASSWKTLGVTLGASALVTGIVAWINRHRVKKGLDKLGRAITTFMVAFLSAMLVPLAFIVTNGTDFAPFLGYFGVHWAQYIGIATAIYNVVKPSLAWWRDRKNGKAITNVNLPNLTPQVQAVTSNTTMSGQPSSSMGTASAGVDVTPPPANLFSE